MRGSLVAWAGTALSSSSAVARSRRARLSSKAPKSLASSVADAHGRFRLIDLGGERGGFRCGRIIRRDRHDVVTRVLKTLCPDRGLGKRDQIGDAALPLHALPLGTPLHLNDLPGAAHLVERRSDWRVCCRPERLQFLEGELVIALVE